MAEEKLFEGRIKKFLHSVGVYPAGYPKDRMTAPVRGWYTKIWGGGFQKSGIPDLLACVNGIMVAIEIKGSRGTPSELQKLNISRINQANGIALFLYPEGFDDFKKIMEGVMQECQTENITRLKQSNSTKKCLVFQMEADETPLLQS